MTRIRVKPNYIHIYLWHTNTNASYSRKNKHAHDSSLLKWKWNVNKKIKIHSENFEAPKSPPVFVHKLPVFDDSENKTYRTLSVRIVRFNIYMNSIQIFPLMHLLTWELPNTCAKTSNWNSSQFSAIFCRCFYVIFFE